jgi:hypothetical protein
MHLGGTLGGRHTRGRLRFFKWIWPHESNTGTGRMMSIEKLGKSGNPSGICGPQTDNIFILKYVFSAMRANPHTVQVGHR